jgi:hypothetical protein
MNHPERISSWTADEVAECLPYQQFLTDTQYRSLYSKLWAFLNESTNPTPEGGDGTNGTVEYPEQRLNPSNTDKVPHWWDKLESHEQKALQQSVEKEFN